MFDSYNAKLNKLKKDKILAKEGIDNILKVIKPGDIINFKAHPLWYRIDEDIAFETIKWEARSYFGKRAITDDVHTMYFLSPDKILNVTLPCCKWSNIAEICLEDLSIWHPTEYQLTDWDVRIMILSAEMDREYIDDNGSPYKMKLIGSKYDIGQLLDFLANKIAGYENVQKFRLFDFGKNKKVCSVGPAALFNWLRHYKEKMKYPEKEIPRRWFSGTINEDKFKEAGKEKIIIDFYKNSSRVDIESYRPSHFSNSNFFRNEFQQIYRSKLGNEYK